MQSLSETACGMVKLKLPEVQSLAVVTHVCLPSHLQGRIAAREHVCWRTEGAQACQSLCVRQVQYSSIFCNEDQLGTSRVGGDQADGLGLVACQSPH